MTSVTLMPNEIQESILRRNLLYLIDSSNISIEVFAYLSPNDVCKLRLISRTMMLICTNNNKLLSYTINLNLKSNLIALLRSKDAKNSTQDMYFPTLSNLLKLFPNVKKLRIIGQEELNDSHLQYLSSSVRSKLIVDNLSDLDISGSNRITDNGLKHLSIFHCLQRFNASLCTGVSGVGLRHLSPSLRRLELSECHGLTDAGLSAICNMHSLTYLSLWHCYNLTSNGFSCLSQLRYYNSNNNSDNNYNNGNDIVNDTNNTIGNSLI